MNPELYKDFITTMTFAEMACQTGNGPTLDIIRVQSTASNAKTYWLV